MAVNDKRVQLTFLISRGYNADDRGWQIRICRDRASARIRYRAITLWVIDYHCTEHALPAKIQIYPHHQEDPEQKEITPDQLHLR